MYIASGIESVWPWFWALIDIGWEGKAKQAKRNSKISDQYFQRCKIPNVLRKGCRLYSKKCSNYPGTPTHGTLSPPQCLPLQLQSRRNANSSIWAAIQSIIAQESRQLKCRRRIFFWSQSNPVTCKTTKIIPYDMWQTCDFATTRRHVLHIKVTSRTAAIGPRMKQS